MVWVSLINHALEKLLFEVVSLLTIRGPHTLSDKVGIQKETTLQRHVMESNHYTRVSNILYSRTAEHVYIGW